MGLSLGLSHFIFFPNGCPGLCRHRPGHSLGEKNKVAWNEKSNFGFWSVLLELFVEHKFWNWEECHSNDWMKFLKLRQSFVIFAYQPSVTEAGNCFVKISLHPSWVTCKSCIEKKNYVWFIWQAYSNHLY